MLHVLQCCIADDLFSHQCYSLTTYTTCKTRLRSSLKSDEWQDFSTTITTLGKMSNSFWSYVQSEVRCISTILYHFLQ